MPKKPPRDNLNGATRIAERMNHYELLNLSYGATQREIAEAYFVAQQTYSPGSITVHTVVSEPERKRMLKRIELAFQVLSDPVERSAYDQKIVPQKPVTARNANLPESSQSSSIRGSGEPMKRGEIGRISRVTSAIANWLQRFKPVGRLMWKFHGLAIRIKHVRKVLSDHSGRVLRTSVLLPLRDRASTQFRVLQEIRTRLRAWGRAVRSGANRLTARFLALIQEAFRRISPLFPTRLRPFSLRSYTRRGADRKPSTSKELAADRAVPAPVSLERPVKRRNQLIDHLSQIGFKRLTGTLCLTQNGDFIRFQFHEGAIEAATGSFEECRFGKLLKEHHQIESAQIEELLYYQQRKWWRKRRLTLGHSAVRKGLVTSEELFKLLELQIQKLLHRSLFEDGEWSVTFCEDTEDLKPARPVSISRTLIGVCAAAPNRVELTPETRFELTRDDISRFPWEPPEIAVLEALAAVSSADELVSKTGLESEQIVRILSTLHNLEIVKVSKDEALAPEEPVSFTNIIPQTSDCHCSLRLQTHFDERSFFSIQFQALETRINEMAYEKKLQIIAVSSAQPQDGKSLVCANLAYTLSKDPERKVALLDCDLRAPTQHQIFGVPLCPGVSNFLEDERFQAHCYLRRFDRLFIMMAGIPKQNPATLFSGQRMNALLESMRNDFDTILIDTPPLQPLSDTRRILRASDGFVLVIRKAKTQFRNVSLSLQNLDSSKLLGTVFNDVDRMLFHTYYSYGYYGEAQPEANQET